MIDEFSGENSFLSNFYPSEIRTKEGLWPTAEHLFQASKTVSTQKRQEIRLAPSPRKAKRLGRSVKLRDDWERVKSGVMLAILKLKFKQNPDLAKKLLATGRKTLIEGNNWHDNIWGLCGCDRCDGRGDNWLGYLLMEVRKELRKEFSG